MIVSVIAAVSENGVIGNDNDLPWHLPEDLKFFKRTTLGHPIIIGRKTFESFGGRPLPKRRNLIITRNPEYSATGAEVFMSLEEALGSCADDEEVFVCGGAQIYEMALPQANRLYLTLVHAVIDGSVCFPEYDTNAWHCVDSKPRDADEANPIRLTWQRFERKCNG